MTFLDQKRPETRNEITWTDDRVELLKKLWGDGLSASQIAAELGGITRNAVIEREINSREGRQKVRGAHEISRCCWPGTIETYPLLPIARSG